MVAVRLSKAGYGRMDEIMGMRTDLVLTAFVFEGFLKEFEMEFFELNKNSK